jgi:hypothetical protein
MRADSPTPPAGRPKTIKNKTVQSDGNSLSKVGHDDSMMLSLAGVMYLLLSRMVGTE